MRNKMKVLSFLLLLSVLSACSFSVRPVIKDHEQSVAEEASTRFHDLLNQQRFDAIFEMLDSNGFSEQALLEARASIRKTFEVMGKVRDTKLVEKQTFPATSTLYDSQVKLAYDSTFENGEAIELFAWNIKSDRNGALLIVYRIEPKNPQGGPSN
jgi:hypothetical protein